MLRVSPMGLAKMRLECPRSLYFQVRTAGRRNNAWWRVEVESISCTLSHRVEKQTNTHTSKKTGCFDMIGTKTTYINSNRYDVVKKKKGSWWP